MVLEAPSVSEGVPSTVHVVPDPRPAVNCMASTVKLPTDSFRLTVTVAEPVALTLPM